MARKPGRPPRSAASGRALQGINLDAVDPVAVLRSIAADTSAPATSRVAAAKALLAHSSQTSEPAVDEATERALRLLAGGRR
jgi:hypothetical protein